MKQEIVSQLAKLADEAKALREAGEPVGQGVVTPHIKAVAANAVETTKLKRKLASIVRTEARMFGCGLSA